MIFAAEICPTSCERIVTIDFYSNIGLEKEYIRKKIPLRVVTIAKANQQKDDLICFSYLKYSSAYRITTFAL
jgi:hypothetical protein